MPFSGGMELHRAQNLTSLQRHLLTLLAKPRSTHVQPWLVLDKDGVRVEPLASTVKGKVAVVAAKSLKAMGWLRARSGGGFELALAAPLVAALLEEDPRARRGRADSLPELIDRAVSASLTLAAPGRPAQRVA